MNKNRVFNLSTILCPTLSVNQNKFDMDEKMLSLEQECYQQQVFTFQFLCRLQDFQFPLTGLGVRDIIRPLFEESSNDLANTNPLFVVIGKRYFSFSMFIVLHKKYAFFM